MSDLKAKVKILGLGWLECYGLIVLSQLHGEGIRDAITVYILYISNPHLECSDSPSAIKVLYY